jgi:hypothetical protein
VIVSLSTLEKMTTSENSTSSQSKGSKSLLEPGTLQHRFVPRSTAFPCLLFLATGATTALTGRLVSHTVQTGIPEPHTDLRVKVPVLPQLPHPQLTLVLLAP